MLFGLFLVLSIPFTVGGLTVDYCIQNELSKEQCIEYVKENSEANFKNLND